MMTREKYWSKTLPSEIKLSDDSRQLKTKKFNSNVFLRKLIFLLSKIRTKMMLKPQKYRVPVPVGSRYWCLIVMLGSLSISLVLGTAGTGAGAAASVQKTRALPEVVIYNFREFPYKESVASVSYLIILKV